MVEPEERIFISVDEPARLSSACLRPTRPQKNPARRTATGGGNRWPISSTSADSAGGILCSAGRRRQQVNKAKAERGSHARPGNTTWRLLFLALVLAVSAGGLVARLVQLQVIEHGRYAREAFEEHYAERQIYATRGPILDRNGHPWR